MQIYALKLGELLTKLGFCINGHLIKEYQILNFHSCFDNLQFFL